MRRGGTGGLVDLSNVCFLDSGLVLWRFVVPLVINEGFRARWVTQHSGRTLRGPPPKQCGLGCK